MRIGIFGGTFNPPHIGHLIVAEHVRNELSLDKIIFIPSFISPHKNEGEESLSLHRLNMTKMAIAGNIYFDCSDIEINKNNISYTVETLEIFREKYSDDKLFLLIGMDNYLTFHQWKEPQKILELSALAVMNRPKFPKIINEVIGTKNVMFVDVPDIDISSSDIRERIIQEKSIRYSVPTTIEEYIYTHNLYSLE
jgi:nicotinate-nucleotide adenylyltransferase